MVGHETLNLDSVGSTPTPATRKRGKDMGKELDKFYRAMGRFSVELFVGAGSFFFAAWVLMILVGVVSGYFDFGTLSYVQAMILTIIFDIVRVILRRETWGKK